MLQECPQFQIKYYTQVEKVHLKIYNFEDVDAAKNN
jgi:hypothetical protein